MVAEGSRGVAQIMALSGCIAVLYKGKVAGVVECKAADIEHLGLTMASVRA